MDDTPYDPVAARKYAHPSMLLPEGKACRDCIRFAGCVRFFGCRAEAVTCDWSPSHFYPRVPPGYVPAQGKFDGA